MKKESGNVLIFILIAIVLLGALTAALVRSGGSSNDTGDYEQDVILATALINYSKEIEQAVIRLKLKGCSENEISFENTTIGHNNLQAPADDSCHVFEPEGGGVTFVMPDTDTFQDGLSQAINFDGDTFFPGVGRDCTDSSCNELVMYVNYIDYDVCKTINKIATNNYELANQDGGLDCCDTDFVGTFNYNVSRDITWQAPFDTINTNVCFKPAGSTDYFYGSVLLKR